jgi:glycosyltransferase involved in cell wall biosynthesis
MNGISVIVITRNEEGNIADCLKSVSWGDEIVLVDSESSDRTVEIAREFTQRIFVRPWAGYADTKKFAVSQANHEWILWLDADERVTPELAVEIRELLSRPIIPENAFEIARRAYFLGKWIKHCGWYPGYVTRLFRKTAGTFVETRVHERLDITGTTGRLSNDLLHFTDDTLAHYLSKFNSYTTLAAQDLADRGKTAGVYDLVVRPPWMFFRMMILRGGFLDGGHGLLLSLLSSAYVFWKYAKLWELRHRDTGGSDMTESGR